MTIRKRLFWSNLMMILVPVAVSALVGACCLGVLWYAVTHGTGLGFEDSEDFYAASQTVGAALEKAVLAEEAPAALSDLLDRSAMSVQIYTDGVQTYAYGDDAPQDAALCTAAAALQNEGFVSGGERSLYAHSFAGNGHSYRFYLFSTRGELSYNGLKAASVLVVLVLLTAVVAAVLLTNRFLTRFVLQKIEQPLDLLADGVRRIRDGELDYRLTYTEPDEFAPVCAAFNEMAARLKDSVERTQRQEENRKQLLAGISHDLRSPLTSIRAYVEGLLDGVAQTPAARQKYLLTIKTKAEDIDRMVSQLFLFSKLDMDEYPIRPETLRLDELTEQLLAETSEQYARRGLTVTAALCPAAVRADPAELRRVLTNVLDNSAKYAKTINKPQAEAHITLARDGAQWQLALTDDGPGVPPEALPRLFDAFYRSDPARKNPDRGSGLGLAIAARALQRMGGGIAAENAPGGGLTIRITLPAAPDEPDEASEPNKENPA